MGRLSEETYLGIKAAFGRLLHLNGGQTEAARVTRVPQDMLSRYKSASPEHVSETPRFPPADVIADLENACGEPEVTRLLARLSGYRLHRMTPVELGGTRLARLSGQVLEEVGQMLTKLGSIVEDGRVTGKEPDEFDREADEAIDKIVELKLQVRAEAEAKREARK